MKAQFALTLLAQIVAISSAFAQVGKENDSNIHTHIIKSKHIDVEFSLRVQLPPDYNSTKEKYEVLYYLDAGKINGFIDDLTSSLSPREIPKMILVGVDLTLLNQRSSIRPLIFTPTKINKNADRFRERGTGGAPRFLECLETEIIALIDSTYRTMPKKRTLIGHSYAGLFCMFALLEKPGLFENIVASSPPLHWDDHAMLRVESEFAENHSELRSNLYYAVGTREFTAPDSKMVQSLIAFRDQLESHDYKGLNAVGKIHEGETHPSNKFITYINGLRYVFAQNDSNNN